MPKFNFSKENFIAFYIILSMFYLWKSGLPQVADLILAISIVLFQKHIIRSIKSEELIAAGLGAFLSWVFIVNILNRISYEDDRFLISIVYYAYNIIIFFLFYHFFKNQIITKKYLQNAILLSLLIQVLYLKFMPEITHRSEGTFNNPNQLGFWALLSIILFFLAKDSNKIRIKDITAIILSIYIASASLSKAALISLAAAILIYIVISLKRKFFLNMILYIFITISTVGFFNQYVTIENFTLITKVKDRISSIGHSSDDNAEGRNYDRIWRFPEYLVLGAGEAGFVRFSNGEKTNEIHSTWGTILFSYGIIGSAILIIFILILFNKTPFSMFIYTIPIAMYGITHNGLRFTLFWIVLAALLSTSKSKKHLSN